MSTIRKIKQLTMVATMGLMATFSFADPTDVDFGSTPTGGFTSITVGDYIFTVTSGNGYISDSGAVIEAGDLKFLAMGASTTVTVTMVGGGAFSLLGVDVGGSYAGFDHLWANMVNISSSAGNWLADLSDNVGSYHFQDLSGESSFMNVTSVTFTGLDGGMEFTLDNLNLVSSVVAAAPSSSSVPEPGTLGVLAACLVGLGLMRRRKAA